jgi:hypothetical protein
MDPLAIEGGPGTVGSVEPTGYPAYARLLHPVDDGSGTPLRWTDVGATTGRTVHPLVQWHRLVGSDDPCNAHGAEVEDGPPRRGTLPPADLDALLGVRSAQTATTEDCWFCVWDGYAWVAKAPGSVAFLTASAFADPDPTPAPEHGPPGFTAEQLAGPRVLLPGRSLLLLHGPLESARFIGDQVTIDWRGEVVSEGRRQVVRPAGRCSASTSEAISYYRTFARGTVSDHCPRLHAHPLPCRTMGICTAVARA